VESQQLTTASYSRLTHPLRPSVGTSNAHCPVTIKTENRLINHGKEMDVDSVHLRISPRTETDVAIPEPIINATPLASGCFSKESQYFAEDTNLLGKRVEHIYKIGTKTAIRTNPTLRDIYDNEVKKASQFVGAVVLGCSNEGSKESSNAAVIQENRLNKFRLLLNDYLSDADGMIESKNVANNLRMFTKSSTDDTFDFTESEVEAFVSELCSQNKIMKTEGWIYNI
jgi:hypothetical protein